MKGKILNFKTLKRWLKKTWIKLESTNKLAQNELVCFYMFTMWSCICRVKLNKFFNILTRRMQEFLIDSNSTCKTNARALDRFKLNLQEPTTTEVQQHVEARRIWIKSLVLNLETTKSYILFSANWKHEELVNLNNDIKCIQCTGLSTIQSSYIYNLQS